jgi:two-component system response regulator DevR
MFVYYFVHIRQPFTHLAGPFGNHPDLWVPRYAVEACREAEALAPGGGFGASATAVSVGPVTRSDGLSAFAIRIDAGASGAPFTHLEADLEIGELGPARTQLTLRGSYRAADANRAREDARTGLRHRWVEAIAKSFVERVAKRLAGVGGPTSRRSAHRRRAGWPCPPEGGNTMLAAMDPRGSIEQRSDGSGPSLAAPENAPIRIMLVDDHELVRKGLASLIDTEDDLEVVGEAGDGPDAVRLADLLHPDVVVMDVRMPSGGGVQACRDLRDHHPEVGVIMLTSYSDDEALFNSIMAGAAGFVLKQIRGHDLIDAIRTVAAGTSLLDPGVTERVVERLRRSKFDHTDPTLARLSSQEDRILDMVAEGRTNREIAEAIHLSDKTVKNYVSGILAKLEVQRRSQAASYVARAQAADR